MSGSWSFSNRSVVEERTRFVIAHEDELYTMAELCRIYGISRETGYYWLHRYREGGLEALRELGRAPRRHPNQTPEEIEQAVLELRRGHMTCWSGIIPGGDGRPPAPWARCWRGKAWW
ncbi:MAG: hypothetical protein DMG88_00415 [Acidobacteria bacterium]|nr:MAG: hypothetical protein DMG88_00415 [Acidobacteriota bacterium]